MAPGFSVFLDYLCFPELNSPENAIKTAGMAHKKAFLDRGHSCRGNGTVCDIFKSEKKSTRVSVLGSH